MKKFAVAITTVLLTCITTSSAFAATEECTTTTGSYGQTSTTCKVLGITTPEHKPVDAGVGDVNFWLVAQILAVVSATMFGASKLAERIYWFD